MHITEASELALLHNLLNAEISRQIGKQRALKPTSEEYNKSEALLKRLTTLNEKVRINLTAAIQAETLDAMPKPALKGHYKVEQKPSKIPVRPKGR